LFYFYHCCGTVTIFYGYCSGSNFCQLAVNKGNQIHTFILCVCENLTDNIFLAYGSGTVFNYGCGSNFLTSYGSGSTRQKVTVPTVPVRQHCLLPILIPGS
jgi:hypothetical protein